VGDGEGVRWPDIDEDLSARRASGPDGIEIIVHRCLPGVIEPARLIVDINTFVSAAQGAQGRAPHHPPALRKMLQVAG
jgi:hypothetical protein